LVRLALRQEGEVNPSAPRHKCRGLLRVDPERRFLSPPSKAGLSAVERVKIVESNAVLRENQGVGASLRFRS
jgi:hypothetical protein